MYALQITTNRIAQDFTSDETDDTSTLYVVAWANVSPPLDSVALSAAMDAQDMEAAARVHRAAEPRMAIVGYADPIVAQNLIEDARANDGLVWASNQQQWDQRQYNAVYAVWASDILSARIIHE